MEKIGFSIEIFLQCKCFEVLLASSTYESGGVPIITKSKLFNLNTFS